MREEGRALAGMCRLREDMETLETLVCVCVVCVDISIRTCRLIRTWSNLFREHNYIHTHAHTPIHERLVHIHTYILSTHQCIFHMWQSQVENEH